MGNKDGPELRAESHTVTMLAAILKSISTSASACDKGPFAVAFNKRRAFLHIKLYGYFIPHKAILTT